MTGFLQLGLYELARLKVLEEPLVNLVSFYRVNANFEFDQFAQQFFAIHQVDLLGALLCGLVAGGFGEVSRCDKKAFFHVGRE